MLDCIDPLDIETKFFDDNDDIDDSDVDDDDIDEGDVNPFDDVISRIPGSSSGLVFTDEHPALLVRPTPGDHPIRLFRLKSIRKHF